MTLLEIQKLMEEMRDNKTAKVHNNKTIKTILASWSLKLLTITLPFLWGGTPSETNI